MKFEQLLQVYWSKGFLYGGKVYSIDSNLRDFFCSKPGFAVLGKKKLTSRFEFSFLICGKKNSLASLPLDDRKIINMYLSQITSINHNLFELTRYNLIRLYLIKTFRGRAQALGKPCRGQRTWSNAKTAYRCNRIIRFFIYFYEVKAFSRNYNSTKSRS